ncbi:pathogenesis-related protein 1-like [Lolium perenne]|uniref:pathogenesis-related protein 1-like n=1 Tax=Lolium perenne TaxID=4522 RepID=UPI0021EAF226|nr:pathogenesis-related protein 1-like [Lolium perenne]
MEYSMKQLAAVMLLALAYAMIVTAQTMEQDMVDSHNVVRANVSVPPVSWDPTVAAYAEAWAEKRRADCLVENSPQGRPYGENIVGANGTEWNHVDAVNFWVLEKQYYDHATNTCSAPPGESCDAYTQLVWRDTKFIGCAGVICDGDVGVFLICSYDPPGNVVGQSPY